MVSNAKFDRESRFPARGLWLGRGVPRSVVGFGGGAVPSVNVVYDGSGHLLTCGPTGTGKFVASVGPVLAQHRGPAIVFDVKGECAQVWSRRRRELGQTVHLFDPFHAVTGESARLDIFDLFDLPGACPDSDCETLAALFSTGHDFTSDRYWTDTGRGITGGLLRYLLSLPKGERKLGTIRKMLHDTSLDYNLAVLLDNKKVPPGYAYDEFAAYLTAPSDKTRPCILSTAQTFMKALTGAEALAVLENSTISLRELYDGAPITIFVVAPQDRLESHRGFWRLILQVLMTTVARRRVMPAESTLFLVDEAAAMGDMPALKQALTLGRGSGMQVHTLWQDLSQLQATFPKDWPTVIHNSGALQAFGFQNYLLAKTWAEVLGCGAEQLLAMTPDEQALYIQGQGFVRGKKLDYRTDPEFAGMFDPNPRYALRNRPPGTQGRVRND